MPRSIRRPGSRSFCGGSCLPNPRTSSSGSRPPTTRSFTSSTTSARSSSRSTSSRRSSTTRALRGIAATNALNDIFAMGGSPLLALSIAAFPESLPNETLAAIFGAADEQVRAAGGDPRRRPHASRRGAEVRARSRRHRAPGRLLAEERRAAGRCALPDEAARDRDAPSRRARGASARGGARGGDAAMTASAARRPTLLRPFEPNAVTDVTGFGLLGHAHEMAERSGVRIELDAAALSVLPRRARAAAAGVRTGGDRRIATSPVRTSRRTASRRTLLALAYDPQTSGGLLIALPADKGAVLLRRSPSTESFRVRIGRVVEGAGRCGPRRLLSPCSSAAAVRSRSAADAYTRCRGDDRDRHRPARAPPRVRTPRARLRAVALPDRPHGRGGAADRLGAGVRVVAGLPAGRVLPGRRRALVDRVREPRVGALSDRCSPSATWIVA